jgi:hypothetical protein
VLPNGGGHAGRIEHGVGIEGVEGGGDSGQGRGEVGAEFSAIDADQGEVIADAAAGLAGGAERTQGVFISGGADGGDLWVASSVRVAR